MATDMFLKIKGIEGESKDSAQKGEIDVLSWSWGATNAGSMHTGGGGGSGKVSVQDLNFTKAVDKASPELLGKCLSGEHLDEALLTIRKAGGKSPLPYLKIKMEKVFVSNYSTAGGGGSEMMSENWTLNFAKVSYVYQPQDDKGAKAGGEITKGWDIEANKEA